MKNQLLTILSLSLLMISCKKEKNTETNSSASQFISDQYIPEITASRLKSTLAEDCHDHSLTLAEQYRSSFEYRFAPGTQSNDKYFYHIERRHLESLSSQTGMESSWSDTGSWEQQPNYYRYSQSEKKAYLVTSLNDPNPVLLFDFNVNVGDTINIASHLSNYDQYVEVLHVTSELVDNLDYPVVSCRLLSCSNCYFTVSPDLPNPLAFEENDLHVELNNSSNVPSCSQTAGVTYSRYGISYNAQWTYWLLN